MVSWIGTAALPSISADFNEVYDDDHIWAIVREQVPEAQVLPGDWVRLYDQDGAECLAIVERKGDRTIDCKLDWSTWIERHTDMSDFFGSYQSTEIGA